MPHVVVKLYPGKSDVQKRDLSVALVSDITRILNYGDEAVSVGFEEIQPDQWFSLVYDPDIQRRWSTLTKVPGYGPGPRATNKDEG
ncbi:tautomerase family protein [Novosphingobium sp. 9]|uniref:tautomerase family protein n=1 Tax=Novosphingobium sp. 9 TaxID=2025349 RepID=UPI0021B57466|nr:tautomerase family protein [Novosphingobium sp. 9]